MADEPVVGVGKVTAVDVSVVVGGGGVVVGVVSTDKLDNVVCNDDVVDVDTGAFAVVFVVVFGAVVVVVVFIVVVVGHALPVTLQEHLQFVDTNKQHESSQTNKQPSNHARQTHDSCRHAGCGGQRRETCAAVLERRVRARNRGTRTVARI